MCEVDEDIWGFHIGGHRGSYIEEVTGALVKRDVKRLGWDLAPGAAKRQQYKSCFVYDLQSLSEGAHVGVI